MLLLLAACDQSTVGADEKEDDTATGPAPATAPIYVHSGETLYTWDPRTSTTTPVGDFYDPKTGGGVGAFADIAIDGAGALYGAVGMTLYRVDPTDASVALWGSISEDGTGLTFLPDGRLLVAGSYLTALDLESGASETLYANLDWSTSGDVVATPDGTVSWSCLGTFSDAWVVFDPDTGGTRYVGDVGAASLWGVAYAEGELYGFDAGGGVWVVDSATGAGTLLYNAGFSFYGATTNPVRW